LPFGLRGIGLLLRRDVLVHHEHDDHDDRTSRNQDVRRQLGLLERRARQLEPVLRRRRVHLPCVFPTLLLHLSDLSLSTFMS